MFSCRLVTKLDPGFMLLPGAIIGESAFDGVHKGMQILRAKSDDAGALTEIALTAKRHWGYPERWIESWRDAFTIDSQFIVSHETYAAVVEGRLVGFYALGRKESRLHLQHMWVLPMAMGRGVGRSLFHHALERAQALRFREFEIESDPNAEGFYQRMGARGVGTSIHELEQGRRELPVLIYEFDHALRLQNRKPNSYQV
jgi:GNAT superfamily N-acetyltransferase